MHDPPRGADDEWHIERFAYFMVRLRSDTKENRLSGIIERLGSGRKQRFSGPEELLGLLAEWPDAPSKIGTAGERSND